MPLGVERGALKWVEGLSGLKPEGLHCFYESSSGQVTVPRVDLEVPRHALVFMQSILYVEDTQLLHACSTSPDAEQDDFCAGAFQATHPPPAPLKCTPWPQGLQRSNANRLRNARTPFLFCGKLSSHSSLACLVTILAPHLLSGHLVELNLICDVPGFCLVSEEALVCRCSAEFLVVLKHSSGGLAALP